ncbi:MAG: hypothetical protein AB7E30_06530 [Lawsonibacter sp.]
MGWIKQSIQRLLIAILITLLTLLFPPFRESWGFTFSLLLMAVELRDWIVSDELSLTQKVLLVLSLEILGVFLINFFCDQARVADQLTIFLGGSGGGIVLLILQRYYIKRKASKRKS